MNNWKIFPWSLSLLAFVVLSLYLLCIRLMPFLAETAALTPFYITSDFWTDMVSQPCGFVYYVASLLQSCFAMPWLGALLLTVLLLLLAVLVRRTFRVSLTLAPLCLVPSLMLLLNYTQVGYMLWLVKTPAVAFTLPLGMLLAVVLAALPLRFGGMWTRTCCMVLFCTLGYWLIGMFGIIACLFVALPTMIEIVKAHQWKNLSIYSLVLVLSLVAPRLMYGHGLFLIRLSEVYVAGMPDYNWNDSEKSLSYPSMVALVVSLLLSTRRFVSAKIVWLPLSLACMIGSAVALCRYTCQDQNLLLALKQKHALERGDYDEVLMLASSSADEPTRANVMLTREALWQLGQAGDKMFAYPDGDAPYGSPRAFQYLRLLCGRTLYYLEGKVNYAYRWCMEDMVEYGRRPDYLKYMAKCALVNGEWKLAEKYLSALEHTLWYEDFAKKYQTYITDHSLVAKDGEMSKLSPLMQYGDVLDGDGGMIEVYLLNSFAYSQGGSRQIVERALMNSLITKNLVNFWPRFMALLPGWNGKIPVHYQEAALMVARLQGGMNISQLPIDEAVGDRFADLVDKSSQNGDDELNATILRPEFGDTFWYYYFFVKGLKTN